MKVTEKIFKYWKSLTNYYEEVNPHIRISKRTYQKIKSSGNYEEYKKKYCGKKHCNKKPINPIQKTYVNLIKKIENITKEVKNATVSGHEHSIKYLDVFQKDLLKTRSLISNLIILDIAITTIGIAFLIALIAF